MNKSFIFKVLYYFCFLISVFICVYANNAINIFGIGSETKVNVLLSIINLILVVIFSIKLLKIKLDKVNILFPIVHLIFCVIMIILVFIINNKLMIPYIHFGYYASFILFNNLLLNVYSILSFAKRK